MNDAITVVITHMPHRHALLNRAMKSVTEQTLQPTAVIIEVDDRRPEAARPPDWEATIRNRALARVQTPLLAWLDDDDDEFLPTHLEQLAKGLTSSNADLAWSEPEVVGARDHRPSFIDLGYLAWADTLRTVGGFPPPCSDTWPYRYSDWGLLAKLLMAGFVFCKVGGPTWRYHIHDDNTVGAGF